MNRKIKIIVFILILVFLVLWGISIFGYFPADLKFEDNGDGTISETSTGLMWDKCLSGQTGNDCTGGYTYFTQPDAVAFCNDWVLAGYDDWKLPEINELFTIVDYSTNYPAINSTYFPNTSSQRNWSHTLLAGETQDFWTADFGEGQIDIEYYATEYQIRCVRNLLPMETYYTLIKNTETGAEFYLDKTINYGDILIIVFLLLFLVFEVVKFVSNFFLPKRIEPPHY